jgi:hypothetical protein
VVVGGCSLGLMHPNSSLPWEQDSPLMLYITICKITWEPFTNPAKSIITRPFQRSCGGCAASSATSLGGGGLMKGCGFQQAGFGVLFFVVSY